MTEALPDVRTYIQPGTPSQDCHEFAVTVAPFDSATLLRLLTQMAPRNISLMQLDTQQYEDSSATLAMTVHDPDRWHTRLPLLFGGIIGVSSIDTLNQTTGAWTRVYPEPEDTDYA